MALDVADNIFYGGCIISMDENCPFPEALATKDERILSVGKQSDVFLLGGPHTKYVQLHANQTLLPGFIEPHEHAITMVKQRSLFTSCSGYYYQSYRQIKDLIDETISKVDVAGGKWCIFSGWDPELISDLPQLSAAVLDDFSLDVPIVVEGQNKHIGWANHKALAVAGVTKESEDPHGGTFVRDKVTNELTGQIMEPSAIIRITDCAPQPTVTELVQTLEKQWREFACSGFTTVTELLYSQNDELDKVVQEKYSQPDCPLRLAIYKVVFEPKDCGTERPCQINKENEKLWFAGAKIVADGSPHCGTIATREPFLENDVTKQLSFPSSPCYGSLNYSDEVMLDMVQQLHEQGKQVAVHAHGERAIEQVLRVYEKVLRNSPTEDRRFRIEHLGLADEDHMQRAAKLNLALSFFVAHLHFYAKSFTESIFGEERTQRWAPLSLATKHGLRWTIHQDHPAFPGTPQPFTNMKVAVTRTHRDDPKTVYGAEYVVSAKEALKAYTIDAAWQIHKDKELGSLTVGKRADLVILSDNPLTVDPLKLEEIKVLDTYLDGRSNNISEHRENRMDGKDVISYSG